MNLWSRLFGPKPTKFEMTTSTGGLAWQNPADSRVACIITSLRICGQEALAGPLPSIAPGGSFAIDLGASTRPADLRLEWIEE